MKFPHGRRIPAHGVDISDGHPTIVFVTACTRRRERWLADEGHHRLLRDVWLETDAWMVGRYVLMPDHLHLFAAPRDGTHPLEAWVRLWKSRFSKRLANPSLRWQADCWDTRLRNHESYANKWEYVRNNPVRHGLAQRAEDWPFQGELNVLPWTHG